MQFYGLACSALAKTPEEVGRMWVGDALRLRAYWRHHPPLHVMVADYLGIKEPERLSDEMLGAALGVRLIEPSEPSPPQE